MDRADEWIGAGGRGSEQQLVGGTGLDHRPVAAISPAVKTRLWDRLEPFRNVIATGPAAWTVVSAGSKASVSPGRPARPGLAGGERLRPPGARA